MKVFVVSYARTSCSDEISNVVKVFKTKHEALIEYYTQRNNFDFGANAPDDWDELRESFDGKTEITYGRLGSDEYLVQLVECEL
jgi:hypothetical protein